MVVCLITVLSPIPFKDTNSSAHVSKLGSQVTDNTDVSKRRSQDTDGSKATGELLSVSVDKRRRSKGADDCHEYYELPDPLPCSTLHIVVGSSGS